ncbi:MAG TPA: HAD-IIA family hydrolase [Actinomycetes bacterium]|nr:HAD-IIA family hydrolase [Actinomycetes bacterium]
MPTDRDRNRAPGAAPAAEVGGSPRLPGGADGLVLDLDGVVYRGPLAVPGSVAAIRRAAARGIGVAYATNNASRTPDQVARHLVELGIDAAADQVVTSAQVAADLVRGAVPDGARVLVVGGEGLRQEVVARGLVPVTSARVHPAAVVQGFGPDTGWALLAEAAYAVAAGAVWVAANVDLTFPTDRGIAPGNGTFVAAVAHATGCRPLVAGKPGPALLVAAARLAGRRALVVGDRLDTDIAGARAAGLASALVLSGVTDADALTQAPPDERPEIVAADLAGLVDGRWIAVADPAAASGAPDVLQDLVRRCRSVWDSGLTAG